MFNIIKHSIQMARKTWKEYLFLIITMSLSLSFLLGFFVYTDTAEYNENKELFSKPKQLITLSNPDKNKLDMLEENLKEEDKIEYYKYMQQGVEYKSHMGEEYEIYFIPSNLQTLFFDDLTSLALTSGNKIKLNKEEVYVSYTLFQGLPKDKNGKKYIDLPIKYKHNNETVKRYYVKECYNLKGEFVREKVFVSLNSVQTEKIDYENIGVGIITNKLDGMISLLQTLGIDYISPYELQEAQKLAIRTDIYTKLVIAIILYILLGVNIYSSFNNTLNKRKFEIGVRRAVGARKRDITLQFLTESIFIMLISVLISVIIIVYISLIYKIVMYECYMEIITIYITKYSRIAFLVVSFFMLVCFSLLFSYKATTIQIVSYLKGE